MYGRYIYIFSKKKLTRVHKAHLHLCVQREGTGNLVPPQYCLNWVRGGNTYIVVVTASILRFTIIIFYIKSMLPKMENI